VSVRVKQPVYLVCGVPGAGKTWVCRQLKHKFHYVPHDKCWEHPTEKPTPGEDDSAWVPGAKSTHLQELVKAANGANKPVISECPFGERPLKDALESCGIEVRPIFVVEEPHVVLHRYRTREGKTPGQNVLTRANTIRARAEEWKAPQGTSEEILITLRDQT
jgi:gluconate kinase